MTTDEFENLIEGSEETDALEFKAAMAWNQHSLAKDILAMSNVRDGGRIVIGIADGTWERQGLTPEQVASYQIDQMKDHISRVADPMAIFRFDVVQGHDGLTFLVITVSPFEELPVICKNNGPELRAGTIYFRTRTRRVESAAISNSSELRQVLLRATANIHRNLAEHGYRLDTGFEQQMAEELGDL